MPDVELVEPIGIPDHNAEMFGSGKTDVDSSAVTQKPYCLLFVLLDSSWLAFETRSDCIEDNCRLLSPLERIYCFNLAGF